MINQLSTIINEFHIIVSNLYIMANKLFTKERIYLFIVLKMDVKLNENLKMG